ncbi:MAG: hypothetical protein IPF55_04415 [Rhodoferax sp.]|nr:hypothetical protein [Rhodoferax sp.]
MELAIDRTSHSASWRASSRLGKQVLVDRLDRPRRAQELALTLGNTRLLRQQSLNTRALGLVQRIVLMRDRRCGLCQHTFRHRQGFAVALAPVVSNPRQAQRLQGDDLLQALDLETGKRKRVLGPRQVQMHVQTNAQLRGRNEGFFSDGSLGSHQGSPGRVG